MRATNPGTSWVALQESHCTHLGPVSKQVVSAEQPHLQRFQDRYVSTAQQFVRKKKSKLQGRSHAHIHSMWSGWRMASAVGT